MIYEYRCTACKHVTIAARPMKNRNDALDCEACGGDTRLKISGGTGFGRVMGGADNPGYLCPVTDQWVDSKRKRREIMKRHDLAPHSSADKANHHSGFS